MKKRSLMILYLGLLAGSSYILLSCRDKQQDTILAVYAGNNPCGQAVRRMLNIPSNAECDRIKWKITLYLDNRKHQPGIYKLDYTYGIQASSRPGFEDGGTIRQIKGTWVVSKGMKDKPNAVVYQLNQEGGTALSFVKLGENFLHLLYTDKSLMIGDASFSYTLNRIEK